MTITVIEANMTGFQHAVINRVTINMLLNMPTIDCVNLFCSKSHYETLKISDSREFLLIEADIFHLQLLII